MFVHILSSKFLIIPRKTPKILREPDQSIHPVSLLYEQECTITHLLKQLCTPFVIMVNAHRVRNSHQTIKPRDLSRHLALWHITSPFSLQIPFVYFFLGPRRGAPMLAPRSLTLSTLSIFERMVWSGVAVPRSYVATVADVSPIFLPSSAWVMVGSNFWRACSIALPTSFPTVLGLIMSSERSTLVRRWPSLPPLPV